MHAPEVPLKPEKPVDYSGVKAGTYPRTALLSWLATTIPPVFIKFLCYAITWLAVTNFFYLPFLITDYIIHDYMIKFFYYILQYVNIPYFILLPLLINIITLVNN